jgi:hypothetical protein
MPVWLNAVRGEGRSVGPRCAAPPPHPAQRGSHFAQRDARRRPTPYGTALCSLRRHAQRGAMSRPARAQRAPRGNPAGQPRGSDLSQAHLSTCHRVKGHPKTTWMIASGCLAVRAATSLGVGAAANSRRAVASSLNPGSTLKEALQLLATKVNLLSLAEREPQLRLTMSCQKRLSGNRTSLSRSMR